MKQPKVLVGFPTAESKDYCLDDFAKQVNTLTYSNYDVFCIDNSPNPNHVAKLWDRGIKAIHEPIKGNFREELARHQNIIKNYALSYGYDYLMMIESDVFTGESIIENLIAFSEVYGAGIVTATYEIAKEDGEVLCLTSYDDRLRVRSEKILPRESAFEVLGQGELLFDLAIKDPDVKLCATGIGCTLFHADVLKEVDFRVDLKVNPAAFSDTYYFTDAMNKGFRVMLNSNLLVEHRKDSLIY